MMMMNGIEDISNNRENCPDPLSAPPRLLVATKERGREGGREGIGRKMGRIGKKGKEEGELYRGICLRQLRG